jgi:nucleoside-diphosphate kinase
MNNINYNSLIISIIKPDAMANGMATKINLVLESDGFKILNQKTMILNQWLGELLYLEHKNDKVYKTLVDTITQGMCLVQVLYKESPNALTDYTTLAGDHDPQKAGDNTIRRLFGSTVEHNAIHTAHTYETNQRQINLFFNDYELLSGLIIHGIITKK